MPRTPCNLDWHLTQTGSRDYELGLGLSKESKVKKDRADRLKYTRLILPYFSGC